jgi:glycosyltransferase involved in cell wall biosynthesis
MTEYVSVIIPCFDAERWLAEAIDSCLAQTYEEVEIIVIDDGSTDRSADIARSYHDRIIFESGSNLGANHARNRGFQLSKGNYIQYLDADDYLLPEKLSRQVSGLDSLGSDVIYEDWRHQHHRESNEIVMEDVTVSGQYSDVLEMLLQGWWVPCCALLVRRQAVEAIGRWDETLTAAQDRDFFVNLLLSGAKAAYQPGCYSVYRRYGDVTISTKDRRRWLENHCIVLAKAMHTLEQQKRLSGKYRRALAQSYFHLARIYFDLDRPSYDRLMKKVLNLDPRFRPRESRTYNLTRRLLGYTAAEKLASFKRRKTKLQQS